MASPTQIRVEFAAPKNYRCVMRRLLMILFLLGSLSVAFASDAVSGRVVKVLPLLLDLQGRDAVAPSLFDRDAYQAWLRSTNQVSALRFDVWCKTANVGKTKLKLRAELRGIGENNLPRVTVLEKDASTGFFHRWTSLTLEGDDYKNFGALVAWRVTLWSGDQMLSEQKSFLW
jgi:hypothetical protein